MSVLSKADTATRQDLEDGMAERTKHEQRRRSYPMPEVIPGEYLAIVVLRDGEIGAAAHTIPRGTVILVEGKSAHSHVRNGKARFATAKEKAKAIDAKGFTPIPAIERALQNEDQTIIATADIPSIGVKKGEAVRVSKLVKAIQLNHDARLASGEERPSARRIKVTDRMPTTPAPRRGRRAVGQ